jgi:hypothetical protein
MASEHNYVTQADAERLQAENDELRREVENLRVALGENSAVLRFMEPKTLDVPALKKPSLRHVAFPMQNETLLVIVNVGEPNVWEPSPEDLDDTSEAISAALDEALPPGQDFSVMCFHYGVKVDAVIVKREDSST